MTSTASNLPSLALGIQRIVVGFLFIPHGTMKFFGVPGGSGGPHTAPEMLSQAWIAGALEMVGGLLLLIGLFTRPVAFVLCGFMAAAYFIAHFPNGFWPIENKGELAVLYCFVFLYFAAAGGGALSIDARRTKHA